jgi:hypothetical protein
MFNFIRNLALRPLKRQFAKQLNVIRLLLARELIDEYKVSHDEGPAAALAIRVTYYLTGKEFDGSNLDEDAKTNHEKIKNEILRNAEEKMRVDAVLRETIVYAHRTSMILGFVKSGTHYFKTDEMNKSEELLVKYGSEFKQEASPELWTKVFQRFVDAKEQFVP